MRLWCDRMLYADQNGRAFTALELDMRVNTFKDLKCAMTDAQNGPGLRKPYMLISELATKATERKKRSKARIVKRPRMICDRCYIFGCETGSRSAANADS